MNENKVDNAHVTSADAGESLWVPGDHYRFKLQHGTATVPSQLGKSLHSPAMVRREGERVIRKLRQLCCLEFHQLRRSCVTAQRLRNPEATTRNADLLQTAWAVRHPDRIPPPS